LFNLQWKPMIFVTWVFCRDIIVLDGRYDIWIIRLIFILKSIFIILYSSLSTNNRLLLYILYIIYSKHLSIKSLKRKTNIFRTHWRCIGNRRIKCKFSTEPKSLNIILCAGFWARQENLSKKHFIYTSY